MKLAERMSRLGTESAFEVLARARAQEAEGNDMIHIESGQTEFTTPAHIKNLVRSVRMLQPAREVVTVLPPAAVKAAPEPIPREEKSPLARKMGKKFVVSVELDPPKGADRLSA